MYAQPLKIKQKSAEIYFQEINLHIVQKRTRILKTIFSSVYFDLESKCLETNMLKAIIYVLLIFVSITIKWLIQISLLLCYTHVNIACIGCTITCKWLHFLTNCKNISPDYVKCKSKTLFQLVYVEVLNLTITFIIA